MTSAVGRDARAADLVSDLRAVRALLIDVFEDLAEEQLIGPSQHHVEPPIWEVGHAAWFQEYWLLRHLDGREPSMPAGDGMYDAFHVSYRRRTEHSYPSRAATLAYARAILEASIERLGDREPTKTERYFYELVIQHECMHIENLIGVRQTLGYTRPPALALRPPPTPDAAFVASDVDVPGGPFLLGAPASWPFAFDNERDAHDVEVEGFRISRTPVTNAEYRRFVEDDGYTRRELWTKRGWQWRRREGAEHPLFWRRVGTDWHVLLFGVPAPLDPWHPVCHVNWHEAHAYCRWAGRRLPTEIEWERAAASGDVKAPFPWGEEPPSDAHGNLDWRHGSTIDVRALPEGDSAYGCRQMIGNVWEWTDSLLTPYPGFQPGPYEEYSVPYFGQKPVLKGGAWVTRARLIRNTWRNFFVRHRRNVFAGFRTCALDDA